jgi:uncharacterized protein YdhG (YjbR/CyaY superfamily)
VNTVDEYLAALRAEEREVLEELRRAIRSAAPEADEVISYRIPMYKQHGDVVGFAAFKSHLSLFVTDSPVREKFAEELEPYKVKNTAIHFSVDNRLPADLVKSIVKARVAENEARAAR